MILLLPHIMMLKKNSKKKTSEELAKATGTSNLPFDIKPPL